MVRTTRRAAAAAADQTVKDASLPNSKSKQFVSKKRVADKENVTQNENQPALQKEAKPSAKQTKQSALATSMFKLLDEAQTAVGKHGRCVHAFHKLCASCPDGVLGVMGDFLPAVDRVLIVLKKEPAVDRLVKFLSALVTASEQDTMTELRDQLLECLITHLLKRCDAKNKAVRYRCCQIIGSIVCNLGEDAEMDEDLFNKIRKAMVIRAQDKNPQVRAEAIIALSRFQEEEEEDPVTKEFVRILETDSSKDCRKSVLKMMSVTVFTKGLFLGRMKDVAPDVRKEAYNQTRERIPLQVLSIKQRNFVVKTGLTERDATVKRACSLLIQSWLKDQDSDIIKLLSFFAADAHVEEAEILVRHLLTEVGGVTLRSPVNMHNTPSPPYSYEALPFDNVLYWRVLCQVLFQSGASETVGDTLLPDTVHLCELIKVAFSDDDDEEGSFFLIQLLKLCLYVDLQDEVGRRNLESLMKELLGTKTVVSNCIAPAASVLRRIHTSSDAFVRVITEVLADLRDPLEDFASTDEAKRVKEEFEQNLQDAAAELEELKAEREVLLGTKPEDAEKLTEQIKKVATEIDTLEQQLSNGLFQDEETWSRMLLVVSDLLQHTKTGLPASVRSLLDSTILPALTLGTDEIRETGIQCLGLFCQLDVQEAQMQLPLFCKVLREEEEPALRLSALKAVFDQWIVFGDLLFDHSVKQHEQKCTDGNVGRQDLMDCITPFLKSIHEAVEDNQGWQMFDTIELCNTAAEGLSKLLFFDHLTKSEATTVLQQLVMLYFDPVTEVSPRLRQCLSVFFPAYASSQHAPQRPLSATFRPGFFLAKAFIPSLKSILQAPKDSSLAKIEVKLVCQFYVSLLEIGIAGEESQSTGKPGEPIEEEVKNAGSDITPEREAPRNALEELAQDCLLYVLFCPTGAMVKALSQSLGLMVAGFNSKHQVTIKKLRVLVSDAAQKVDDKPSLKHLDKVSGALKSMDATPGDLDSVEEMMQTVKFESMEQLRNQEPEHPPKKAKKVTRASRGGKPAAESDDEEAEETTAAPARQARTRRATRGSKVTYKEVSSSGDEESD